MPIAVRGLNKNIEFPLELFRLKTAPKFISGDSIQFKIQKPKPKTQNPKLKII